MWCADGRAAVVDNYITDIKAIVRWPDSALFVASFLGIFNMIVYTIACCPFHSKSEPM
jgi:hypothetical protein